MQLSLSTAIVALAALVGTAVSSETHTAAGETHTVSLRNFCGAGTQPVLKASNGTILVPTPDRKFDYVSNGPLIGAIAYLQERQCGAAGQNCTVVKTTLRNGALKFNASSTGFALNPPYAFSQSMGFKYVNGCDGSKAYCNSTQCPDKNTVITCTVNNVGLLVSFCGSP